MAQRDLGDSTKDFDATFFKHVYSMIASIYNPDDSAAQPPPSLPVPKTRSARNPVTPSTFQSKIADLRLRRMQDRIDALHAEAANQAKAACDNYAQMLHSRPTLEIDEVFKPERARRRNYPLYLENEEKDRSAARWRPKQQPARVPLEEINRNFSARLEDAKEKGSARAQRRLAQRSGGNSSAGTNSSIASAGK
jgi:hypothetical protein